MALWQRRKELGAELAAKTRLYLDVRFWNDLCDAELDKARTPADGELLRALREKVASGKLACPVEVHVVEELHRQSISEKRAATLALIDELSTRAVLLSPTDRLFLEVLRLVQGAIAGSPPVTPPYLEIWTRPPFAIAHDFSEFDAPHLPRESVEFARAEMEADWWKFGFVELFEITGPPPIDPSAKHGTAGLLNAVKDDPTKLFESYEATYWSEVRGVLDAYAPQLADVWRYLYGQTGADPTTISEAEMEQAVRQLRQMLYQAARKTGLRSSVPTLHTGVTLYSRMQWDRKRRYKGNDVFDFAHAEAALPYCNGFATDASLASLIRQSRLTDDYKCDLLTDTRDVIAWVSNL